ncbi:MAG: TrbC/VirB2 family protein [Clostridia bacterium]|nr:TrbC/VirB2 family protein [Clostridia bacterium]
MNRNILIRILVLFILSMMLVMQTTYAVDDIIEAGGGFIKKGEQQQQAIQDSQIKTVSDQIYNILLAIGTVIAVIIGAILGIQFMVGSMDEKAKVKESLIPFVIGCVIIFGAFGIWKLIATILQDV